MKTSTLHAAVAAAAVLSVGGIAGAAFAAGSATTRLVYMCADTQGHPSNCANNQEFEVFDRNGAPIFSVGETGGAAVFGDNSSVYGPSSVTSPRVTVSYTDPATYNRTFHRPGTCSGPAAWFEPHGIWSCQNSRWVKKVNL